MKYLSIFSLVCFISFTSCDPPKDKDKTKPGIPSPLTTVDEEKERVKLDCIQNAISWMEKCQADCSKLSGPAQDNCFKRCSAINRTLLDACE